jgi:hypothetical protein
MEERVFHLRSVATHNGDSNDLASLEIELESDGEGEWQALALTSLSPPFRAFVCSALMCQHAYLRMNAAERDLILQEARGELWLTSEDWLVRDITAHFKLLLLEGHPSPEDLEAIAQHMRDCPISKNLHSATKRTTLETVTTFR